MIIDFLGKYKDLTEDFLLNNTCHISEDSDDDETEPTLISNEEDRKSVQPSSTQTADRLEMTETTTTGRDINMSKYIIFVKLIPDHMRQFNYIILFTPYEFLD